MQRNQVLPSPVFTGSFALAGVQMVSKFASSTSQQFLRPDHFDAQGCWYRVVEIAGTLVAIKVLPSGTVCWMSSEHVEESHIQRHLAHFLIPLPFPPEASENIPDNQAVRFLGNAPLVHIASASLGEAVIKAVIRQVISALQAKKLLHRFIAQYGPTLQYDGTTVYGFPSVERMMDLSPDDLIARGLGYKARIIPRIARDLLENQWEEKLQQIPTEMAVELLQQVKGIGRWTARVAICDLTGDWSVYPCEDLAVRTWASRLWPDVAWPRKDTDFFDAWQTMHGHHTGLVTFYVLAQASLAAPNEPSALLALS